MKFAATQIIVVLVLMGAVLADGSSEQDGLSDHGISVPITRILPPDLSNYPDMFVKDGTFNAVIVVGNQASASDVIAQTNLILFFGGYTEKSLIGSAKLSSEIKSLKQNIIAIGSACNNPTSAEIMGNPKQCDIWLEPGKAMIILYGYKDYVYMVIAGNSDKGTRDAADFLINTKKGSLKGSNMLIEINEPNPDADESNKNEKVVEDKIENVDVEKENEEIISELNERIARISEDSDKKIINPATINKTIDKSPSEEKQAIKAEQKEQKKETGVIKKVIDWFRSLFS